MFPSLFECQWKKTDINFKLIFSLKTWLFPTLPHKLGNMPPDFTQDKNGHYEPTVKDTVTLGVLRLETNIITLTLTKCHESQYDYCEPAQDMATLGLWGFC